MKRIAVFGASGFIGATVVERLLALGNHDINPIIHSSGNAWRLSRHGIKLASADVLDERSVRSAIDGCSHVVNCILGSKAAMLHGLNNILRACQDAGVKRFVHLSSVSVYDGQRPGSLVHENVTPKPKKSTYGWIKLRQDEMVKAACGRGLPSIVICPPNISGIYSSFLLRVVASMREGRLAVMEDGKAPCSLVDIQDVAQAIEQALFCDQADGSRVFVTNWEDKTWFDLVEALAPLADCILPLPSITRDESYRIAYPGSEQTISVLRSVKFLVSQLVSREFRKMMMHDPLLGRSLDLIRALIGRLPKPVEYSLLDFARGSDPINNLSDKQTYDAHLCGVQWRAVRYSYNKAKEMLKYEPRYSFSKSIDAFCSWYKAVHGLDSMYWPLLRQL